MKTQVTTIALLIALFSMSCGNTSNHDSHSHDSHSHHDAIELNKGEKWKINEEMTPFILNSENLLSQYNESEYKSLAEELAKQNQLLINSCTMDGKSHDELHKWLHPHLELVTKLTNAENEQEAKEVINELKQSFKTFETYFE